MGADFLGAFLPMEVKSREGAKARLREYSEDYLLDHLMEYFAQDFDEEDGKSEYEMALAWVDDHIEDVYDIYEHGRRDSTIFTYKDIDILVTGGMSWGDDPTDSFLAMGVLQSLDLTLTKNRELLTTSDGGGKQEQ